MTQFVFNPNYPNATDSQKWEQIRLWRSQELNQTDWTQLEDSPVTKSAWATYRQALRDLPDNFDLADDVVLPVKPIA
jgi:hypothetical protein